MGEWNLIDNNRSASRCALLTAALVVAFLPCTGAAENPDSPWLATWSTANEEVPKPERFRNQTLREIVHTSIGGRAVRIRLARPFGTQPVTFDAIYLGLQQSGAKLLPGSNHVVTFGGSKSVTIR